MDKKTLEAGIARYPICEYAFIEPRELKFLDRVRYICETECPRYGKSWSCPPAVGTVEECKSRCEGYTGGFLFTTLAEVSDPANLEEGLATRKEHEKITRQVRELFQRECREVLALSSESCAVCPQCAYPDGACRFPEKMLPCIESYGILVTELAERHGISFFNGSHVITWFGLLLFAG